MACYYLLLRKLCFSLRFFEHFSRRVYRRVFELVVSDRL